MEDIQPKDDVVYIDPEDQKIKTGYVESINVRKDVNKTDVTYSVRKKPTGDYDNDRYRAHVRFVAKDLNSLGELIKMG